VVVNNLLYVAGGFTGTGYNDTFEVYDSRSDSWRTLAGMPTARGFLAAADLILPPRPLQQAGQLIELPPAHVLQLPRVHLPHRLVKRLEEPEPLSGDPRGHESAVVRPPLTLDQALPLHSDEQPGDIRLPADHHALAHLSGREPGGPGAPEDA
jgi:hypothetical protein